MTSLTNELHIDIETYASTDLAKCGVYKYCESEDFEILLFAYSLNGKEVQVIDLAKGEEIPDEIIRLINDDNCLKIAHNAQFERISLSRYLGLKTGHYLSPKSWRCTMTWAAYLGLPFSLDNVGKVLKLDKQKMGEGKELIRYFCVPCKPTKTNGQRTRNYYYHDKNKWNTFKEYNKRDVETELAIAERLSKYPVPDFVWEEYYYSELINDNGVLVDFELINNAINIYETCNEENLKLMQELTNLDNPNSVSQLKIWLNEKKIDVDTLGKKDVEELLKNVKNEEIRQVLELRQQVSKSSIKKYIAMENAKNIDVRVRGMFMFYGASRTGRFSSKIVQLQNLKRNNLADLNGARELVKKGYLDALKLLYDDVTDVLSQLIRTAFIPSKNNKFIVSDFSAIEARVIAWLAGEKWRIESFKNGDDIYCASASKMFNCKVEKHGENSHLRPKGKIAELALGYGGSVGALKAMGALDMGLVEEELESLVRAWREANKAIVKLWWDVDKAVRYVIQNKTKVKYKNLIFYYKGATLFITLPSGRNLAYAMPRIDDNNITYKGTTQDKKWDRIKSYGPKFVENIIQGIARDILCYSIKTLTNLGYKIVMTIHDEVVIDASKDMKVEDVVKNMCILPDWADGLILNADGYECEFYQKD